MEPTVTKYLLFDHFAGKSTPMQKRLIEAWLHKTQNQETYYQWLLEWEHQSPQYLPELDARLNDYRHFMHKNPTELASGATVSQIVFNSKALPFWKRGLVAASLVLCICVAGWLGRQHIQHRTYETSYNETRDLTLSDGTRVVMNANSRLQVPRFGFGRKTREVILSGEANFSVMHTLDNQKFIVRADHNMEVVVLGTEFTVYSRKRGAKVVLNKGKVQLRYREGNDQKQVTMKPGDLVLLDPQGHASIRKTPAPQNYAAWAAHRFVFEGTTLHELTYLFEDNFGLKVKIEDEDLRQLTLYGSFQAQSAEELLKALT
jgi:transmembrane sensor